MRPAFENPKQWVLAGSKTFIYALSKLIWLDKQKTSNWRWEFKTTVFITSQAFTTSAAHHMCKYTYHLMRKHRSAGNSCEVHELVTETHLWIPPHTYSTSSQILYSQGTADASCTDPQIYTTFCTYSQQTISDFKQYLRYVIINDTHEWND